MKIDDGYVMEIISDQRVTRVMHAAIPIERTKECKIFPVSTQCALRALRIMSHRIVGGSFGYRITLASIN